MSNTLVQILILSVLIVLNGFFCLAEFALAAARKSRLEHAAQLPEKFTGRIKNEILRNNNGDCFTGVCAWLVHARGYYL